MLRMNSPSGRTRKMYFSMSTVLIRVPMWRPAASNSSSERRRFSARGIASLSSMSWLSNMLPLHYLASSFGGDLREAEELVNYLHMSDHHPPAAIPAQSKLVQNLLWPVAGPDPLAERLPLVPYEFTTGEASDGNDHCVLVFYL